jgi:hypothetical protein
MTEKGKRDTGVILPAEKALSRIPFAVHRARGEITATDLPGILKRRFMGNEHRIRTFSFNTIVFSRRPFPADWIF